MKLLIVEPSPLTIHMPPGPKYFPHIMIITIIIIIIIIIIIVYRIDDFFIFSPVSLGVLA